MCEKCEGGQKKSDLAEQLNRYRVFPRIVIGIFICLFYQSHVWSMHMIETGVLSGDWIGPAYVGAWVAGFVKIAQDYSRTGGNTNTE